MAEQVFPRITRLVGRVESSIDPSSNPICFHGDSHPFVYSTYPHPPTDSLRNEKKMRRKISRRWNCEKKAKQAQKNEKKAKQALELRRTMLAVGMQTVLTCHYRPSYMDQMEIIFS